MFYAKLKKLVALHQGCMQSRYRVRNHNDKILDQSFDFFYPTDYLKRTKIEECNRIYGLLKDSLDNRILLEF